MTNLGSRVRLLRKELRLSLEQLSAKSGVALATLSRIENDRGSSTLRTHQKIAEALDIAISDLYKGLQQPEHEAILVEPESEEAETFTYDEKSSAVLLTKQISGKQMLPQLITLQPTGKTSLEQYPHTTERWLFLLKGTVEVTVASKTYRLSEGNTLYFRASLAHQIQNTGESTAKIISVSSPAVL